MNKFAGSITYKSTPEIDDIKFDFIDTVTDSENTHVFVFWNTDLETSIDIIKYLSDFWEIISQDVSIEGEDNISLLNTTIDTDAEWVYESVTFEWAWVNFNDIQSRFLDSFEVVSVREAEDSKSFWNKVIKVDFVY